MNTAIIMLAFAFVFFVVLIWFSGNLGAQEDLREWLEDHWKAVVFVVFVAILIAGILLS